MPTNRQPSWRTVADALAKRLYHHATAAGTAVETYGMGEVNGCFHTVQEADLEHCPFCADRAAYLLYLMKKRTTTLTD